VTAPDATGSRPGDRWRQELRDAPGWQARDTGPGRQFSLDPEMFRWSPEREAETPPRPSRLRALEALPEGGSVLDVGVGGGASSLGLAPRAGLITGVDHSEGMLASFRASAAVVGIAARAVLGTWPDVAPHLEPADVAVCHHAIYGVAEIEDFLTALTAHARYRVVVEVSQFAPPSGLNPLWEAIHGEARPDRVVADEVEALTLAMGLAVGREDLVIPAKAREVTPNLVAFARRRLQVDEDRDAEIEDYLRTHPQAEQRVIALWWPGAAGPTA
jgi:SAM-dependent methyltransferase